MTDESVGRNESYSYSRAPFPVFETTGDGGVAGTGFGFFSEDPLEFLECLGFIGPPPILGAPAPPKLPPPPPNPPPPCDLGGRSPPNPPELFSNFLGGLPPSCEFPPNPPPLLFGLLSAKPPLFSDGFPESKPPPPLANAGLSLDLKPKRKKLFLPNQVSIQHRQAL